MSPQRPRPEPTPVTRPFWQAARRHVLELQQCRACGRHVFYPRSLCPHCGSERLEWERVSGRGSVYSFTIARRPTVPGFEDAVPYVIAIVELAEGPRMTCNVVGCDPGEVRIGMPVEAVFEDLDEEIALVQFRPART